MSPNRSTVWARALVDELARAGLRDVVIAPGSRSTPLVLAFHDDPRVRTWTHLDERSAGFFALGVGKATAEPAAVVTTSGTAVANLFPAVVEAAQSEAPLLLLTADRPLRLRGTDANQTISQVEIFGSYPRAFFDLGDAKLEPERLAELRATARKAVSTALGLPAGPVHVNVPFDKPLEPGTAPGAPADGLEEGSIEGAGGVGGERFEAAECRRPRPDRELLEEVWSLLRNAGRGLVVAGPVPEPGRVGPALRAFGRATGYPLLADPLSGGRYGSAEGARIVGAYDLILRQKDLWEALAPEVVVRVGRAPTSAALGEFLEWAGRRTRLQVVLLDPGGLWEDSLGLADRRLSADPTLTLEALSEAFAHPPVMAEWAEEWGRADEVARRVAGEELRIRFCEGTVLAEAVAAAGAGTRLFVGSSLPVRDLDAFGFAREDPLLALGNRGASGIDGSVSTALGMAVGSTRESGSGAEPAIAVLGDVAFLHDANGLLVARQVDAPVVLVVIQNDGGGIFHMLPIREHEPAFTRHFATPHGLDLRHLAALHGLDYRRVMGPEGGPPDPAQVRRALRDTIQDAREHGRIRVLEVVSDREENRRVREEVVEAVRNALA